MIRVFIADDHAIVRHGLRQLVEGASDMRLVGEASDGRELLAAAETGAWDVLVLDLSLPKVSGLEAMRRLRAARAEARHRGPVDVRRGAVRRTRDARRRGGVPLQGPLGRRAPRRDPPRGARGAIAASAA